MAFAELGLNEVEFWRLPPFRTYLMQMKYNREIERRWEQTRQVLAMQHNTAQGRKRILTPQRIIRLSFDAETKKFPEWTQEEAQKLIRLWKDIPKKN